MKRRILAVMLCFTMVLPALSCGKEGDSTDMPKHEREEKPEEPKPINTVHPLYTKAPQDCTDEEYKEFYQTTFHEFDAKNRASTWMPKKPVAPASSIVPPLGYASLHAAPPCFNN